MGQWVAAGAFDDIDDQDVKRVDYGGRTFAVYRVADRVYRLLVDRLAQERQRRGA